MVEFNKKIVQFGFGAVGKSFFEKVFKEIKIDIKNYYVISKDKLEYSFFLELGGKIGNFIVADINKNNYEKIFSKYLSEGDFLIDFADSVGTKDFIQWCAYNNIMYLNTGETDWQDNWYSIFEENIKKNNLRNDLKKDSKINKYPIVLQHGNNPGLVSHFVKAGLEYIVKNQFKNDSYLNTLLKESQFNKIAYALDLKEIHVNDNDTQEIKENFKSNKLHSTWSVDSFFFEMLSNSTANIGTFEKQTLNENINLLDDKNGFLEFNDLAINTLGKTYYPKGKFNGYLVPHEETITISKSLEVTDEEKTIYRPTVIFLYSPCNNSIEYFKHAKINDDISLNNVTLEDLSHHSSYIIRGFKYPEQTEIVYKENIKKGTEYVGVLLLGSKFNPVWIGNRIKPHYLYKNKQLSFWQTPTITPVAMSALAVSCWMIKNQSTGGIYFPDDIRDYKEIINFAEKYISKTIYKTFSKKKIEHELGIKLDSLQLNDIIIKKEK